MLPSAVAASDGHFRAFNTESADAEACEEVILRWPPAGPQNKVLMLLSALR